VGWWDLDSLKTSGTFTTTPPEVQANPDNVAMTTWGGSSTDCAYLFTPSGTLKTNNLPNYDGKYRIITSKAMACSGPAPLGGAVGASIPEGPAMTMIEGNDSLAMLPPGGYYKLDGVWRPTYTISISPTGEVNVSEGVDGAPDSLYRADSPPPMTPGAPLPPYITTPPANNPPTINQIDIKPPQNPDTLPAGVDAALTVNAMIQFNVQANDADGDVLSYQWEGGGGNLSARDAKSTEWTPPSGATVGTRYTVQVMVDDGRGGTATATRVVQIVGGGRIFFGNIHNGVWEIFKMNEDGSGRVRVASNFPYVTRYPCISADGQKIVCISTRDGNSDIYTINTDGSGQTRLTFDPALEESPSWSPDGTKIVFSSDASGLSEVYVMNANGSGRTRLTFDPVYGAMFPCWSPDGNKIAFQSARDGGWNIYTMDADGTNIVNVTNTIVITNHQPAWSPDGQKIVFYSNRSGNPHDVYVMNADGGMQTQLTSDAGNNGGAVWSPNGNRIAFISSRDGNNEVYVMNPDGSGQIRLTHSNTENAFLSWSR